MLRAPGTQGGSSSATAVNYRGSANVVPGATVTLVSFTAAGERLRGFRVEGDGDAQAWVEVNGSVLPGTAARRSVVKVAEALLPLAETLTPGVIVALRVRCDSSVTSAFDGTLYTEL